MAQHSNYWFETCPSKHLITSGIIKNVDILIIGGGIAGISLLYTLISNGVTNVYLVEESTVGFHSSGRSSGQLMLRGGKLFSHMSTEDGIEYLKFISDNNRRFLGGLRNVGFDTDLRDCGGFRFARTTEEMFVLDREADFIKTHSGLSCPSLSKEDANKLFPDSNFLGGIYIPTESVFNPYKIVNGLYELISQKGIRVLTGCQVTRVIKSEDGFSVSIRHKGIIKAKKIVYCTDAYTSELLPNLNNTILSFRGQMIATDFLDDAILMKLPQMGVTCGNEYFRLHGGRLLVGGMRQSVRGHQNYIMEDGEISPAVYDRLRSFIKETLPMVGDTKVTHTWSGIMCTTPDDLPLIGKISDNEFVFCAFNNYGYSHALGGSIIIKDMLIKGESLHPGTKLFDPKRFI